ncbi:MAG TPA: transposase, partial [Dehalococcoidia bacterium]|nr:transposase [Dehalococcoidia bacterium]
MANRTRLRAPAAAPHRPPASPGRPPTPVGEAFRPPAATPHPARWPIRKVNRLPLESYREAGAYALTFVTQGRISAFTNNQVARYCLATLKEVSGLTGFQVFAYCFMPDHLHLLVGT